MTACQSIGSFNTTFPVLVLYLISAKLLATLSALEGLAIHRTGEGGGDTSLVPSGLKESQKLQPQVKVRVSEWPSLHSL